VFEAAGDVDEDPNGSLVDDIVAGGEEGYENVEDRSVVEG